MKIINGSNHKLLSIGKDEIINDLSRSGVILLRDFKVNVEDFSIFIGSICSKVTNDPARIPSAKNTQLIESGEMEMGLHLENGNAPFMPDFQFFYCEVAPTNLSRTTYCDGCEAYNLLDAETAEIFANRQIMYSRNVSIDKWKKYFSTELQRDIDTIDDVREDLPSDVEIIKKSNDTIHWRVRRHIVYQSKSCNQFVLAHCIYGPSLNYEIPAITWSDGSMINPNLLSAIEIACNQLTRPIPYQDGDVVVVDNHRVMHGREKILDNSRKIYGGQGYL